MVAVEFHFLRQIDSQKGCAIPFRWSDDWPTLSLALTNFTGAGHAHQGKYKECILLWLKANLRDEYGMVREEPSCWRIPQLQRQRIVQCEICDHRGRSLCPSNQGQLNKERRSLCTTKFARGILANTARSKCMRRCRPPFLRSIVAFELKSLSSISCLRKILSLCLSV